MCFLIPYSPLKDKKITVIYSVIPWVKWSTRHNHGWSQVDKFWKFDLSRLLEIAISDSFKDLFQVVSLHHTGDCIWVHSKMCTKHISQSLLLSRCSTVQQELKCLCLNAVKSLKQLNRVQFWSYRHAINLDMLDCSRCFAKNKLKTLYSSLVI